MALDQAVAALEALLGTRLSATRADRDAHGASETWYPLTPPDVVAWPETTAKLRYWPPELRQNKATCWQRLFPPANITPRQGCSASR